MICKITMSVFLITGYLYSIELSAQKIPLTINTLEAVHVKIEEARFKNIDAVRVTGAGNSEQIAIVRNVGLKNGVIEIDVAGQPLPGSDPTSRGFIGIAFRIQRSDSLRYECFYLRPTNGRAEDQLRRNHSTQYISHPRYPWFKLRKENPGVYESYADLVSGEWTRIRVVIKDNDARLFVNGASQPSLIVKDLKQGITHGSIALWIGTDTEGYFSNLRIEKE